MFASINITPNSWDIQRVSYKVGKAWIFVKCLNKVYLFGTYLLLGAFMVVYPVDFLLEDLHGFLGRLLSRLSLDLVCMFIGWFEFCWPRL